MRWDDYGKYAKRCGNYAVCKVFVSGEWRYELWQLSPQKFISRHASFEEARTNTPQT